MILRGNYYRITGKNSDLYKKRNSFCESCPFNSKNIKDKTLSQWVWGLLGDFCVKCGCPLKSKLVEPMSFCPKSKWEAEY
jgi:hypothetical protein